MLLAVLLLNNYLDCFTSHFEYRHVLICHTFKDKVNGGLHFNNLEVQGIFKGDNIKIDVALLLTN